MCFIEKIVTQCKYLNALKWLTKKKSFTSKNIFIPDLKNDLLKILLVGYV